MLSLLSLAFLSQNIGSLICILMWLDHFLHLEDAPICGIAGENRPTGAAFQMEIIEL